MQRKPRLIVTTRRLQFPTHPVQPEPALPVRILPNPTLRKRSLARIRRKKHRAWIHRHSIQRSSHLILTWCASFSISASVRNCSGVSTLGFVRIISAFNSVTSLRSFPVSSTIALCCATPNWRNRLASNPGSPTSPAMLPSIFTCGVCIRRFVDCPPLEALWPRHGTATSSASQSACVATVPLRTAHDRMDPDLGAPTADFLAAAFISSSSCAEVVRSRAPCELPSPTACPWSSYPFPSSGLQANSTGSRPVRQSDSSVRRWQKLERPVSSAIPVPARVRSRLASTLQ